MSKFFIIASIIRQKKIIGYRVFDCDTSTYIDSSVQNITSLLKDKKVSIENAILDSNKITGSSGSLERITKIDADTLKAAGRMDGRPYIVINKLDNERYTLVDYTGKMEVMDKNRVLQIHDTFGLANCKVMHRGDNYIISPIAGNLINKSTKIASNSIGVHTHSDLDIILSNENLFIRNGLVRFNVTDKAAYDIVNSNRPTVPIEIMKKYCIGPIYFNKKGSVVRIASMFTSGIGANYMTRDFGNIHSIPCNGIKDVKISKHGDNFLLKIIRCVVGSNKKCIDIEDKIMLSNGFDILAVDTTHTIGSCPANIKTNDNLYRRVARYIGIEEFTNEEEYKRIKTKFKGFKDITWVLETGWDLVLENVSESLNFTIDENKTYWYIVNDVDTEEEMNHTMIILAEKPDKSFNVDKISRPFTVKMLELDEADDEKSALIKLKLQNDIVINNFKKVNILKEISNIMEVK